MLWISHTPPLQIVVPHRGGPGSSHLHILAIGNRHAPDDRHRWRLARLLALLLRSGGPTMQSRGCRRLFQDGPGSSPPSVGRSGAMLSMTATIAATAVSIAPTPVSIPVRSSSVRDGARR